MAQSIASTLNLRRPRVILPVPTPAAQSQRVQPGVPDSQLTREATGLLRGFSTPLLHEGVLQCLDVQGVRLHACS
jgi:hypothetical protein